VGPPTALAVAQQNTAAREPCRRSHQTGCRQKARHRLKGFRELGWRLPTPLRAKSLLRDCIKKITQKNADNKKKETG